MYVQEEGVKQKSRHQNCFKIIFERCSLSSPLFLFSNFFLSCQWKEKLQMKEDFHPLVSCEQSKLNVYVTSSTETFGSNSHFQCPSFSRAGILQLLI